MSLTVTEATHVNRLLRHIGIRAAHEQGTLPPDVDQVVESCRYLAERAYARLYAGINAHDVPDDLVDYPAHARELVAAVEGILNLTGDESGEDQDEVMSDAEHALMRWARSHALADRQRNYVGPRRSVLEVDAERDRQDATWGPVQDHPDGVEHWGLTGDGIEHRAREGLRLGIVTYANILMEEVGEALQAEDDARLRAELIQVAAVCCKWVEAIDRRTS